ncbi:MAG: CPBP family intramembrane metalloprotease [Spirochaetales bacterium]|nr:CPBP family intramembrane metalloprotease [Spirochaetales bacterium]
MKKPVLVLVVIWAVLSPLFSENGEVTDEPSQAETSGQLRRTEVVIAPAVSAALVFLTFVEDVLFYYNDFGYAEYLINEATLYSVHLPVYSVNALKGLAFSAATAVLSVSYELLRDHDAELFRSFMYTGIYQAGLYSTYAAYRDNRKRAKADAYDDEWRSHTFVASLSEVLGDFGEYETEWRPYDFFDLVLSPFRPENFLDPAVYILPISGIVNPLITRSHEHAPWNTGRMYLGTWEMSPFAAIPLMIGFFLLESSIIGIAEESHFRGFIYEEVGSTFGHVPAKIVDCLYFPAIHVPQEIIIGGFDTQTLLLNFAVRSLLTFYLDNIYDRGGLPRSIAAHMWMDFSLLFMYWLMESGVPQSDIDSILAIKPQFTIRIPLSY